ncbi:MAG: Integral membrane protein DUF6 [Candidatus Roizmanbacteria bacterium GW2011_GWA2_36_23]|uniref:Integral membrane protein DUF6 n=1 Tax=Candidatus Roizmanbacteria bacterium GW2011_GWA2_36_23 TaxID=1618480 RepID=A0A0G0ELZ8_9BACT|nr:MAG: Integral membrane protein DUF6 [Candidatus Roizmanbacteria bacterium GW2011_GWA2_36_23]
MWFWISLLGALFSAVSVILNKRLLKTINPIVLTWCLFTLNAPLYLYFAFKDGLPRINNLFYVGVLGSSLFFVFSKNLSLHSFKHSLLSRIYPLTAFGPFFAYILALIFLGERISVLSTIGMFIVIGGIYILNIEQAKQGLLKPFKLIFQDKHAVIYLFAIVLSSFSAFFDKLGVINTYPINASFTLFSENLIMAPLITMYLFMKKYDWIIEVKNNFLILLIASMVYGIMCILIVTGFASAPLALAYVVKKFEILFVLFFSYILFKDKSPKNVWVASVLMIIGALFIRWG